MAPTGSGGPGFSVAAAHHDGEMVIEVRGELDLATAPELDLAISEAIHLRPGCMVIDLAGVSFMDSTACRSLIHARAAAADAAVEMRLRSVSPVGRRALEILHLDELFTFADPPDGHGPD
jgi:anti-sigma B factor antagonist